MIRPILMVQCKFCSDKTEYDWFQDQQDRWHIGIKLDINNYRPHKCSQNSDSQKCETNNKRNWSNFICEKCESKTRQNIKLIKPKELNLCLECSNSC